MPPANAQKLAIWLTIAAVVVVVSAFMPWGTITGTPSVSFNGAANGPFGQNPFGGMTVSVTIDGWQGSTTVAGIVIPNWLKVFIAAAAATVAWLAAGGVWAPPRYLLLVLAGVGLAHTVVVLIALVASGQSSIGIGGLLTAASFGGMIYACVMLALRPAAVEVPKPVV